MGRGPTREYHQDLHNAYVEGTLTCLKQSVIKKEINNDFPLVLNIEPTNACNLRCICCPRETMVLHQGTNYLSIKNFKKIVDEASEFAPLIMLNLHKDGEPLLHKNLPEMVAYARKKEVAKIIHLNTNGTLLNTNRGRRLLDAGIDDITISIDAAFPETYFKLKKNDKFDELCRDVESVIDYRNKTNAKTIIRVKIMEFDLVGKNEINAFLKKWQDVADVVQITGTHNWSGAISDITITDETSKVRYPCGLLWYALAVNSNGKVSICNVDWDYSGVVGNIGNASINEIWQSESIRKIRRAHLSENWNFVPVCNECVVWTSVGNMKGFFETKKEFL